LVVEHLELVFPGFINSEADAPHGNLTS
jgi:hypothetical protein